MIVNDAETKIASSQGWADKSSFCFIDLEDRSITKYNLENAEYVRIKKLKNDYFLSSHCFKGEKLVLAIHSFDNPALKLGRLEMKDRSVSFEGDLEVWQFAPRFIVEWLKDKWNSDYYLIELDSKTKEASFHAIDWFHADEYDRGYQGLYDVVEIPETDFLLFPIQRNSNPVLYDFSKKAIVSKIELAGRFGDPLFQFRKNKTELWTVDYDTLVRLEVGSWKILQSKKFQGPIRGTTMAFVGDFAFTANEQYCALARPYSKDILLLEADKMREIGKIGSNYEPLQVAILSGLECVYRDWKTGEFDFQSFSS